MDPVEENLGYVDRFSAKHVGKPCKHSRPAAWNNVAGNSTSTLIL